MNRSRRTFAALAVALGSVALIFAAAGRAAAQTSDNCDNGNCDSATAASADTANGSGATVVHDDGGDPSASNDSGAALVHSDGGSPSLDNGSGAAVVQANGGSPSVSNDSGAVLVEGEAPARAPSSRPFVEPVTPIRQFQPRVIFVPTRLPVTGGPVSNVALMALGMLGFGAALLAGPRVASAFASPGGSRRSWSPLLHELS